MSEITLRTCGGCALFEEIDAPIPMATDVVTGLHVVPGKRNCSAHNVAWADSGCVTGEFKPKSESDLPIQES